MSRMISVALVILLLQACSTAGSYVTNITSAGNNELSVEKCAVEMNPFLGTLSMGACTTQNVKVQAD